MKATAALFLFIFAFSTATAFPSGRCYVHECAASPYAFTPLNTTCFSVTRKPCVDSSKYDCCTKFSNLLYKIILKSKPECKGTVQSVFVNGVRRGGGIYFENNELRITNLNMKDVTYAEVCVNTKSPCANLDTFCPDCQVAVFDPQTHTCCPTCDIAYGRLDSPPTDSPPGTPPAGTPDTPPTPPPGTPPSDVTYQYCECKCREQ